MAVFLGLNGYRLRAPQEEVVSEIFALAGQERTEEQLVQWVRSRMESQSATLE